MVVLRRIEEMRQWRASCPADKPVALVPTMGAYHAGHAALMRYAVGLGGRTVVSLFVNPLQFGPGEDFGRYPRDPEGDAAVAEQAGVDVLFMPAVEEMYPEGRAWTFIDIPEMTGRLCGRFRPGHFTGVLTVVAKLLNVVQPTVAIFGEKDRQQLLLIRRMVTDLNFPCTVVGRPTVREPDGLAMSSRNRYLTPEQRRRAAALYAALCAGQAAWQAGERSPEKVEAAMRQVLATADIVPEYADVVDGTTLAPWQGQSGPVLLAVAARVGEARLIDNLMVEA